VSSDLIPDKLIQSYREQYYYFTKVLRDWRGTVFSNRFKRYLNVEQVRGVSYPLSPASKRRITKRKAELVKLRNVDPLLQLFEEWGEAERAEPRREEFRYEGKLICELVKSDRPKLRMRLADSVKHIYSLRIHEATVDELVDLASIGNDESLFQLVQLDKVFLTAKYCQKRIWQAQGQEDKEFFKMLSSALLVDTYRDNQDRCHLAISCYLLWFLGYKKLPNDKLLEFVRSEGLVGPDDYMEQKNFDRMLRDIGLRKRYK